MIHQLYTSLLFCVYELSSKQYQSSYGVKVSNLIKVINLIYDYDTEYYVDLMSNLSHVYCEAFQLVFMRYTATLSPVQVQFMRDEKSTSLAKELRYQNISVNKITIGISRVDNHQIRHVDHSFSVRLVACLYAVVYSQKVMVSIYCARYTTQYYHRHS